MKILVGFIVAIFLISPTFASTQTGKVIQILVRTDGLHWFHVSGPRGTRPTCTGNHTYWMIKDENSAYGKSQMSMMLAAYTAGKNVKVEGAGVCTRWGDGEDITTLILQ